jgi:HK97 family phage major capsid protein
MQKLHQKSAEREVLVKAVADIFAKGHDSLTDEDLAAITEKNALIKGLDAEIAQLKEVAAIAEANAARLVELAGVDAPGRPDALAAGGVQPAIGGSKAFVLPARFKGSNPRHFRSISDTRAHAQEKAFKMGMFLLATIGASQKAAKWCGEHGLSIVKAQAENVNEAGGFLVPEELDSDLIQLREMFGVVRQEFKRVVMKSDAKRRPRRTGGLQAYHLADGDGITASQKGWDSVNLTAEKIAILALYGNELSEDAIIDVADDLAHEIAWSFSLQEDEDGLLGNGTSASGGFVGVVPRLLNLWSAGGGAGLIQATGNGYSAGWDSITLPTLNKVKAAVPRYAALADPCWVCSEEFYAGVMERLLTAAGGNRVADIQTGGDGEKFLGKRVVIAQVMPLASAQQQVPLLYGAFRLGADFGDRRETTIAISNEFAFGTDQVAIRGTERYAINVHDVGGSGNAANPAQPGPQAGPIVGLVTPAA